jgi:enoyl-CoA hydratase/carnithine racemase
MKHATGPFAKARAIALALSSPGGAQRFTRFVGMAQAKELLLLGDTVNGEEAYPIGLVNRVVRV